jgi:hypothetical protein
LLNDPDAALRASAALALARIDPSDQAAAAALQNEFVKVAALNAAAAGMAAGRAELTNQLAARQRQDQAAAAAEARRRESAPAEDARKDAYLNTLMARVKQADLFSLPADQLQDIDAKMGRLDPSAIPYIVRTINELLATSKGASFLAEGMDFT